MRWRSVALLLTQSSWLHLFEFYFFQITLGKYLQHCLSSTMIYSCSYSTSNICPPGFGLHYKLWRGWSFADEKQLQHKLPQSHEDIGKNSNLATFSQLPGHAHFSATSSLERETEKSVLWDSNVSQMHTRYWVSLWHPFFLPVTCSCFPHCILSVWL